MDTSKSHRAIVKAPQLKTEVQEFKRLRILEEARELFYLQGYEATTLDAIADRLKVTKPFIYSYFKNKSEILNAICHVGISRSLASLDEALASGLAPREMLRHIVEQVTSIVLANQKYITVYLREEKNLEKKEARELLALRKEFSVRLAKLLEAGTVSNEFDVDDALLTAVLIGGMITYVATWYRPHGRWSQSEINLHMIKKVERMVMRTVQK
jgi:AcrR family transcriptional regulator